MIDIIVLDMEQFSFTVLLCIQKMQFYNVVMSSKDADDWQTV